MGGSARAHASIHLKTRLPGCMYTRTITNETQNKDLPFQNVPVILGYMGKHALQSDKGCSLIHHITFLVAYTLRSHALHLRSPSTYVMATIAKKVTHAL